MSDSATRDTNAERTDPLRGLLSPRAIRMVERAYWIEQPRDHKVLEGLFARAGLLLTTPILRFQQLFGGLSYTVRGNTDGWTFDLVWKDKVAPDYRGGKPFVLFTTAHRTAQFGFSLDLDAAVFVDADDHYIQIASAPEKIIESDAVVDELLDLAPRWVFIPLGSFAQSDHRVDDAVVRKFDLKPISEASDAFGQWWESSEIRLQRTVFFTREPTICYFLYAKSLVIARAVVTELLELGYMDAEKRAYYSHPFGRKPVFQE